MKINVVPENFLIDRGQSISVSIVDSGFQSIPPYAKIYGDNPRPSHPHGNRILSIFTAPDGKHPLSGLKLNLACYNPNDGYKGLAAALRALPQADMLSLSMAWKEDDETVKRLMLEKARTIFVPALRDVSTPFPSSYAFVTTCANGDGYPGADYSIVPRPEWQGNSYAVPAVARLYCYGDIMPWTTGIGASILFKESSRETAQAEPPAAAKAILTCPHCKRTLRDRKTFVLITEKPEKCPYCGRRI